MPHYTFKYTELSSMLIDVDADTEEEAWNKLHQWFDDGDINYSELETFDSKNELVSIDNKAVNPPKEEDEND